MILGPCLISGCESRVDQLPKPKEEKQRYALDMVIVKATKIPKPRGTRAKKELLSAMANFNEEMVKAGVMLDGNGLQPFPRAPECGSPATAQGDRQPIRGDQGIGSGILDRAMYGA